MSSPVRRPAWRSSPQQVDPLSWFIGPRLPLTLGAASVVQAVATTTAYWNRWSSPALQLVAIGFFVAATLITAAATRVDRRGLGVARGAGVLGIALAGLALSAWGAEGGSVPVEMWWAPTAVGLVLGGFAPFASAQRVVFYAVAAAAVVGLFATWSFAGGGLLGSPLSTSVIAVTPIALGAVALAVFSTTLIGRTNRLLAEASHSETDPESVPPRAVVDVEADSVRPPSATIARVSAQTVPFLRAIAAEGVITEADRTLAAHLARELRAELVTTASRSWLDVLADGTSLVVSDPTRLADRMNDGQRAALRGMLQDMLATAVVDRESLLIELRAQSDGSTAVALSLEIYLPEGRRVVMLAPYYLTLKDAVENLSWKDGKHVQFTFQIPPAHDR